MLREGDTLVIKSLDRLSRNKEHITQELRYFKEHHIQVRVLDLPTTMIELSEGQEWVFQMINNILIEVLSSIAEQERVTIRQRQAEGIVAAKAQGKHLGRPVKEIPTNWEEVYNRWKDGEITAVAAMKELGIKKVSVNSSNAVDKREQPPRKDGCSLFHVNAGLRRKKMERRLQEKQIPIGLLSKQVVLQVEEAAQFSGGGIRYKVKESVSEDALVLKDN